MDFQAAMFDFDGTVTNKGEYWIPDDLMGKIVEVGRRHPVAFCTGRQLESFERHGLDEFLKYGDDFLKNLYLIAENGSIGYFFDVEAGKFQEFYRVDWPEEFVEREVFKRDLGNVVADLGSVYDNHHRVIVVIRTRVHYSETREIQEVYRLSGEIYERVMEYLKVERPDFGEFVNVGNSGIGVVICPKNGDKDRGIMEFASFLREKRGLNLDNFARDILVIGDNPQIGGNDHRFLNSEYGTPYTVGNLFEANPRLKVALDDSGERVFHAEGTLLLLQRFFG